MAFSNAFRVNVMARVGLMSALLFALLWSMLRTGWDAMPLVCAVLVIVAIIELFRYVERGTRDLTALMQAVAHNDFTSPLPRSKRGAPFNEYEQASRTLVETYRRLNLARAASDELLGAVVGHVGVAVLCFDQRGRVAFANSEAQKMLGSPVAGAISSLSSTHRDLPARLLALKDNERTQLSLPLRGEPVHLLLHARRFVLLGEHYSVVACHSIGEEMESREVEAWQSLTRVLTHEMMNSLTPIIALCGLVRETLKDQVASGLAPSDEDMARSIDAIHERSSGLLHFVESYRQFSNPPQPVPCATAASDLLDRVARLQSPELARSGIVLNVETEQPSPMLHVDPHQIEQVLINLVRNAQQALVGCEAPRIRLSSARDTQGGTVLQVTDNGPGIDPSLMGNLFVPFFTTRPGGTGIGLTLSRQLTQLNRGRISVRGTPGECVFTLRFSEAK
jgi:nitrogen fixation/metabolism regulation signal transduction histidine kinase